MKLSLSRGKIEKKKQKKTTYTIQQRIYLGVNINDSTGSPQPEGDREC